MESTGAAKTIRNLGLLMIVSLALYALWLMRHVEHCAVTDFFGDERSCEDFHTYASDTPNLQLALLAVATTAFIELLLRNRSGRLAGWLAVATSILCGFANVSSHVLATVSPDWDTYRSALLGLLAAGVALLIALAVAGRFAARLPRAWAHRGVTPEFRVDLGAPRSLALLTMTTATLVVLCVSISGDAPWLPWVLGVIGIASALAILRPPPWGLGPSGVAAGVLGVSLASPELAHDVLHATSIAGWYGTGAYALLWIAAGTIVVEIRARYWLP